MKKVNKADIDKFGEASVASVVELPNTYIIVRDKDGFVLAEGEELKGYKGDIIRTMYQGFTFEEGKNLPYLLESDRHGRICVFR